MEIENWTKALNRKAEAFPYINSLKGMVGHCLSASGSIECVASVLQINKGFIFGNVNCEDIHPKIVEMVGDNSIPRATLKKNINVLAKASFGFGDVNAAVIFGKH